MGDSRKQFHLQASKGMEWCPKPPGPRQARPRPAQVPTLLPADSSPQRCREEAADYHPLTCCRARSASRCLRGVGSRGRRMDWGRLSSQRLVTKSVRALSNRHEQNRVTQARKGLGVNCTGRPALLLPAAAAPGPPAVPRRMLTSCGPLQPGLTEAF
ncbi:unnamed protein product [Rangifer tarandus platyrhynchus]|uniref:Uncharacterized protein n=2 Tax=Rangifer tarandus platyrhynchus TaxID=3082113 RepID=A0ACB0EDV1_RANTA|nr:unnamed protein product [Rangifer tarandus platyrhynchus]CAI9698795.1 unnamed protein product [Rangifer tarandus platyrhynchus]